MKHNQHDNNRKTVSCLVLSLLLILPVILSSSILEELQVESSQQQQQRLPSLGHRRRFLVEGENTNNTNSSSSSNYNDDDRENSSLCPLVGFLPFTSDGKDFIEYDINGKPFKSQKAFTHLASALLAIDHFNSRINIVIPELTKYTTNCSIQIPTTPNLLRFADTKSRVTNVPKFLIDEISANRQICSIVGPYTSEPSVEASTFSAGLDVVTVSHGADDNRLSMHNHPLFVRTSVNLHPMGDVVVSWLRNVAHRTNYLAILHISHDFSLYYSQTVDNAAKESNFTHITTQQISPPFTGFEENTSIRRAMYEIKKSGYRTIFVALHDIKRGGLLHMIADAAEEYGLNNGEYVYFIATPHITPLSLFVHLASENANTTKLLNGAATIRLLDGFSYNNNQEEEDEENNNDDGDDKFLVEWQKQNSSFVQRVNELHPIQNPKQSGYYQASDDYFQTNQPASGSAFMYDAIMTIALGKCQEEKVKKMKSITTKKKPKQQQTRSGNSGGVGGGGNNGGPPLPDGENLPPPSSGGGGGGGKRPPPPKKIQNNHLDAILKLKFTGATGIVEFGENNGRQPRNRVRDRITYGIYNFRRKTVDNNTPNTTTQQHQGNNNDTDEMSSSYELWYFLTDMLQNGSSNDGVHVGTWTTMNDGPFIYADETSIPPILLRDVPEQNFLSFGVHVFGLTLMSVSLVLSILTLIFIKYYESNRIIKSSQPIFLYILVFGTIVLITSIITISYDESYGDGWSDGQLDSACLAFPWLVSIGYITIYCALFMKLWRINQVLQFRRRTVKVRQVFGPFILLVLAAVVVLTVWSVIDPLSWERNETNFMTGESYGKCVSDNGTVYISVLASLMGTSTLMTAWMAYQTKDIDDRFSESSWIFYTIFVQIQVFIVGIPILIILEDASVDATYFGRVLLIWTISISTLLPMFGPKVVAICWPSKGRGGTTNNRGSAIGTGVRISMSQNTTSGIIPSSVQSPSSGYVQSTNLSSHLSSQGDRDSTAHSVDVGLACALPTTDSIKTSGISKTQTATTTTTTTKSQTPITPTSDDDDDDDDDTSKKKEEGQHADICACDSSCVADIEVPSQPLDETFIECEA